LVALKQLTNQMEGYPRTQFESYTTLREVLDPKYAALPDEHIEELIHRTLGPELTAEDYEGIFDQILGAAQSVGGAITQASNQAAPYMSPALKGAASGAMAGSALGPWGMLGGALLGGTGAALSQSKGKTAHDIGGLVNAGAGMFGSVGGGAGGAGVPGVPAGAIPTAAPSMPPSTGSPAAGQLLNLLGQPQIAQALMSMMMGALGRQNIQVGSTPVPVGAFSNLLGMLANRASAEYNVFRVTESEAVPEYLTNESGEFRCDIANPEARAEVLWELLQENYNAESEAEREDYEAGDESYSDDEFYNALELALGPEGEEAEY
jgi:hypothetical protein